MARPKGQPKIGGRQKGSLNKVTANIKGLLKEFASNEIPYMIENINDLSIKERGDFLVKILPYLIPKEENKSNEAPITQEQYFEINGKKITF